MQPHLLSQAMTIAKQQDIEHAVLNHHEVASPARRAGDGEQVTIRLAHPDDAVALQRLARLDGRSARRAADGDVLVADVGGTIAAALPLDGRPGFADPFRRTSGLSALLELRADQLARAARRPARHPHLAALRPRVR